MNRFLLFCNVCVIVLLSIHETFSQNNQQEIVPPSPSSAAYTKYVTYNVSLYNGLPDVSVPLYTLQLKDLNIPLVLNYHASGIKFRQNNGEVGVGWSFSAGFRASRTIYGYPDERRPFAGYFQDSLNYYEDPNLVNGRFKRDRFLARYLERQVGSGFPTRPNLSLGQELDGEYDRFNVNLPTGNGAFIITDRTNRVMNTTDASNMKVQYAVGPIGTPSGVPGITALDVVDGAGNKFFFGASKSADSDVFEQSFSYENGEVNSAWALTDVETVLGDQAHFDYSRHWEIGWNSFQKTFSVTDAVRGLTTGAVPDLGGFSYNMDEGSLDEYYTFKLDEITTTRERVVFERVTGQDEPYIKNIRITDINTNQLIRRIEFLYGSNTFHTFLETIKIYDKEDHEVEVFKFDYYSRQLSSWNFVADQWGFYLPAANTNLLFHKQFADDLTSTSPDGVFNDPVGEYFGELTWRDRVGVTPDFFALLKITYPTGGSAEYEYESNRYMDLNGQVKDGGGLRIKKISSNDQVAGETLVKEYVYGDNESGFGHPVVALSHKHFASESIQLLKIDDPWSDRWRYQRTVRYSTRPVGDVDPGGGISSYVIYPSVTEYTSGTSTANRGAFGKVVYAYDLRNTLTTEAYPTSYVGYFSYIATSPQYVRAYRYWNAPTLSTKTTYKYDAGDFTPVKEESFFYEGAPADEVVYRGLRVRPLVNAQEYDYRLSRYYDFVGSFFSYGAYEISTGKVDLVEKREKTFTSSGEIETRTVYAHNAQHQVIQETAYRSKLDEQTITYYRYPQDVVSSPGTDAVTGPISFMVGRNMISTPLEITKTIRKGNDEKVYSSHITSYKGIQISPKGQPLSTTRPSQEYFFESAVPVPSSNYTQFTVSHGTSGESYNLDSRVKLKLTYDSYDSYGNLLQLTPASDMPVSYSWGYDGRYPVAECKNASVGEFYFQNFEVTGNTTLAHTGDKGYSSSFTPVFTKPNGKPYVIGWWSLSGSTWVYREEIYVGQALTGVIDDVRITPRDARLSTYTYDRFFGMTSATTAGSATTYYEYDNYGRVARVKDRNRDILQKYDYKFADAGTRYFNTSVNRTAQKQGCSQGYTGSSVTYSVPGGAYVSSVSPEDAQAQAQHDLDVNTQVYANLYGTCLKVYGNTLRSVPFTRNNCDEGMSPGTVDYVVAANKYTSTVSQEDAEAKAQADIDTHGQAYANEHATCNGVFYNEERSDYFTRNNCSTSQVPGPSVQYVVAQRKYTSTVSLADANARADADLVANGQNYANTHGQCIPLVEFTVTRSVYSGTVSQIIFYQDGAEVTRLYPSNNGAVETFTLPEGNYKVIFEVSVDDSNTFYLSFKNGNSSRCAVLSGTSVTLQSITLDVSSSNGFRIQEFCQ